MGVEITNSSQANIGESSRKPTRITWVVRFAGAILMIAIVHAFMVHFAVPSPAAWYLGAIIYAGLVAVLFDESSIVDKISIYVTFGVVTVVGSITVCPCTGAHFFLAPIAGMLMLGMFQTVKFIFRKREVDAFDVKN